jgi:carbon monoxide dehydrogenase subunit G
MHVQRTFTVPRPVEAVFDYLSDFTSTNDWDPGTVETTRTAGDGGVGTTYHNVSDFMGRRTELTYETLTLERPAKVEFRGRNKKATTLDTLTLEPDGDGTRITYRAYFDLGVLINLVAPFVLQGKLEKLADETVEQMQRVIAEKV